MTDAVGDTRGHYPVQRRVPYRRLRDNKNISGSELQSDDNSSWSNGVRARAELSAASSYNHSRDDDNNDDEENIVLYELPAVPTSIWHEIWLAIRHGAPFLLLTTVVAALACFYAVVWTTSYKGGTGTAATLHVPTRYVPSADEQLTMHDQLMHGATTITIGQRELILQGGTASAGKQGHMRLPDQFYQGIHLGVCGWDEWGVKLSDEENKARNSALREVLRQLDPQPTAVYPTIFQGGAKGFTVSYLVGHQSHQVNRNVKARTDPVWSAAERAVLEAAQAFQQLVIMKWHPNVWGPGHEADRHRHTSVLQEVRPTRTGLRRLSSTVAVYRVHSVHSVAAAVTRQHPAVESDGVDATSNRGVIGVDITPQSPPT